MGSLPRNSIPSLARYFTSLSGVSTEEKSLLTRLGSLVDAIVESERGLSNIGGVTKRTLGQSEEKVEGTVDNIIDAARIQLDKTNSKNLSHYEVQIDSDSNFSDPTTVNSFGTNIVIRGLAADNYTVRARAVKKDGIASLWNILDTISVVQFTESSQADSTVREELSISDTLTITADRPNVIAIAGILDTAGTTYTFDVAEGGPLLPAEKQPPDTTLNSRRDVTTNVQTISFDNPDPIDLTDFTGMQSNVLVKRLLGLVVFDVDDGVTVGDHEYRIIKAADSASVDLEASAWVVI